MRPKIVTPRTIKGQQTYTAESLEKKLQRVMSNNEAIKDSAPLIYTDRKDGVLPDYDMRTDKYEYLVDGFDKAAKSKRAKRDGIAEATKDLDKKNEALKNEAAKSDKPKGSDGDA